MPQKPGCAKLLVRQHEIKQLALHYNSGHYIILNCHILTVKKIFKCPFHFKNVKNVLDEAVHIHFIKSCLLSTHLLYILCNKMRSTHKILLLHTNIGLCREVPLVRLSCKPNQPLTTHQNASSLFHASPCLLEKNDQQLRSYS